MQKSLAEGPKDDPFFMGYGTFIYPNMASAFVIETERWDLAAKLFEPLQRMLPCRISRAVHDVTVFAYVSEGMVESQLEGKEEEGAHRAVTLEAFVQG